MRAGRKGLAKIAVGALWILLAGVQSQAQDGEREKLVPKAVPIPRRVPMARERGPVADPVSPPAQMVSDERAHLTFRLPAGWNLAKRDGEVSTFHLDARTAAKKAEVRAVASLAFNPYPASTFSGALFYVSVTPHSSAAACVGQTSAKPYKPLQPAVVGDVRFARGKDEHGHICTEARDVAYTALRRGSCVRFDLAVNTFCGGDDSGVKDMTEAELGAVFKRLEGILGTVEFEGSGVARGGPQGSAPGLAR